MLALLLAAALAGAAPVVTAPRVQQLRAAAGLPPFDPARLARLDAPTLAAAHLQASHDLLARLSPRAEPALVAEARAAVEKDRLLDRLGQVEAEVARGGAAVDQAALDALYAGGGWRNAWLKDLVRDGASGQAAKLAAALKMPPAQVERLRRQPQASVPAAVERRLAETRRLLERGLWTEAWATARDVLAQVSASGLRRATRQHLGIDALRLLDEARWRGAPRLYGARRSGLDETVARQKWSDCAVHQLYNHPALRPLAALVPYRQFLRGVEAVLERRARRTGLSDSDTGQVLRALGLERKRLSLPVDAAGLAALLRAHGPLTASIRWDKPKSVLNRSGNHAVLIREERDGRFVVIDSNYRRPLEYTFEELGVLSLSDLAAVEAGPDPAASAAAFVRDSVPAPAPWWRRVLGLD